MPCVLFVDDEPSFLYSLRRMLKLQQPLWQYEFVQTAREAQKLIGKGGIDVVVTDMSMPGIDGLKLLDNLKKDPATRNMPVILLTGRGDEASAVQAMHHGAADYLVKDTVTQESLERAIINALEKLKLRMRVTETYSKLEEQSDELEKALACVKLLGDLLPVCKSCRRIKTEKGKWLELESYIEENPDSAFKHTMCDSCRKVGQPVG